MKIVVIGCTHAGTSAIINSVKLYQDAEITVYERNDNISFLSCGIALYIGKIVEDISGLFYSSPEYLSSLGVNVNINHDVLDIDVISKTIIVKDLLTGKEKRDIYDKLIITSGSWPICPSIKGIDLENILLCKNYNHAKEIIKKTPEAKKIAVVGAGYIGVELVEAFHRNGKEVILLDIEKNIMTKYLDKEFSRLAEDQFIKRGITLALGEKVEEFQGNNKVEKILTNKSSYDVDLVILCIGFEPNTEIFKDKIDMLSNGAIIVDEYMRTSNKDIMAAGDCCAVWYNPLNEYRYIPLATNAIRTGSLVAKNLFNPVMKYIGTQGTSAIKIYDINIATTGLTETESKINNLDIDSITINENYRPEFMPSYAEVMLKLVYDKKTRILLGAQLASKEDYTQTINTLSVCIHNKMTVDEIAIVDQFFQPHFNKPWNIINTAALNIK